MLSWRELCDCVSVTAAWKSAAAANRVLDTLDARRKASVQFHQPMPFYVFVLGLMHLRERTGFEFPMLIPASRGLPNGRVLH